MGLVHLETMGLDLGLGPGPRSHPTQTPDTLRDSGGVEFTWGEGVVEMKASFSGCCSHGLASHCPGSGVFTAQWGMPHPPSAEVSLIFAPLRICP